MPDEIESAVVERTEMLFESHLRFAVQLPLAAHAACRWDRSALDRSVGLQCGAEFCPSPGSGTPSRLHPAARRTCTPGLHNLAVSVDREYLTPLAEKKLR